MLLLGSGLLDDKKGCGSLKASALNAPAHNLGRHLRTAIRISAYGHGRVVALLPMQLKSLFDRQPEPNQDKPA